MSELIRLRASGLGDFLDCAARAEAKHLLGLYTPSSGSALLGTALHKSTAAFDASRLDGATGITADDAFGAAADTIRQPDEEVVLDEDESPQAIEDVARALHSRYCSEIAPLQNFVAVEVTCTRLDIPQLGISLTGTTDRIRRTDEGDGICDVKSGKAAVSADGTVKTAGHRYQLGVYELIAEYGSGIPITAPGVIFGLQVAKTAKGQRVAVSEPVRNAREVLTGDADSPGVLEIVSKLIHAGLFAGNPRSMFCGQKFCPIFNRCKFRQ
jgi:hypothetical protein